MTLVLRKLVLDILLKSMKKSYGYTELRYHKRKTFSSSVKDGKIDLLNSGIIEGVCARVLLNGNWGFSSTTIIEEEKISNIMEGSASLARSLKPREKNIVELAEVKPYIDTYNTPMKIDPNKMEKDELVALLLDVDKDVRGFSNKIVSDNISFDIIDDELTFLSSEGAQISQRIVRCLGEVNVTARENGILVTTRQRMGAQSGLEILKNTSLRDDGEIAAERADRLVSAKAPPAGVFPVIIENDIVGLFAHEAIGHPAEADLIQMGTALTEKIGEKVASEKVTLVDDGCYSGAFGTMKYDDEGVPTTKTVIIDKGILKSYMHTRETAQKFNVQPTGNARAWTFEYDPIVRMTNTYIEKGDYNSINELAEDMKEGYLLRGPLGGQAHFHGEFMFTVQEVIKIKNGDFSESLRGVAISGNSFDVMKNVDAIANDFVMGPAECGKDGLAYVGHGGASVRTRVLMGGA